MTLLINGSMDNYTDIFINISSSNVSILFESDHDLVYCRELFALLHSFNQSADEDSSRTIQKIHDVLHEKCPVFSSPYELRQQYPSAKLIHVLGCTLPLILILFGVLGNTLSAWVMFKRARKGALSSYIYLALLAIVDILVLFTGCLIFWLEEAFLIQPLLLNEVFCQTLYFLKFWFTDISAWLIVAVSFERFIAVRFPLRANISLHLAHKISLFIILFFGIYNLHNYITIGFDNDHLQIEYGYIANFTVCDMKSHKWLSYIDTGFYAVLPSICILILNLLIITTLLHSRKIRNDYLQASSLNSTDSSDQRSKLSTRLVDYYRDSKKSHQNQQQRQRLRRYAIRSETISNRSLTYSSTNLSKKRFIEQKFGNERTVSSSGNSGSGVRLIVLLLTISCIFVVCTIPITIRSIIAANHAHNFHKKTMESYIAWENIQFFMKLLMYLNHSINFILYCLSGRSFRNEVKILFNNMCCLTECHIVCVSNYETVPLKKTYSNKKTHTNQIVLVNRTLTEHYAALKTSSV